MSQFHIIVFGPLLGFLIAGLFAKQIGDRGAMAVTTGLVTLSAILSAFVLKDVAFDHNQYRILVLEWVRSGSLSFDWTLYIDSLTAVMLVVVNTVSALVHWYSIGYMSMIPIAPAFLPISRSLPLRC